MKYALVIVDVAPLHLDHTFTYSIPDVLRERVFEGSRVRVTFANRKLVGYVVGFTNDTDRPERISPLLDVLCDVPVVTPEILKLTYDVSRRWIGPWSDVLKASVPPRQIRVEQRVMSQLPVLEDVQADRLEISGAWSHYNINAPEVVATATEPVRIAAVAAPGDDVAQLAIDIAYQCLLSSGAVAMILPDIKEVRRVYRMLLQHMSPNAVAVLVGDDTPSTRYQNFLRVLRGEVRMVIGTRATIFAPLPDLKTIILTHDSDSGYAEQRSPAWHAREVAMMRATQSDLNLVVIDNSRSTQLQRLVQTGEMLDAHASAEYVREHSPRIVATSSADVSADARFVRIPTMAFAAIRDGLRTGPVLVQVPRRGYQLHLSCARCRESVRCAHCNGPMSRKSASSPLNCMRCGAVTAAFNCPWCQSTEVRSSVLGAIRTAEEFGRAFPGTVVKTSGKDHILEEIPNEPSLVIATPGAQPRVKDGHFAAAVILDADATLMYSYLSAHEDSLHRWSDVAALVLPTTGRVIVVGDDSHHVIDAFTRCDSIDFATKELQMRTAAHMIPAFNLIEVICDSGLWAEMQFKGTDGVRILGPVPFAKERERILVISPWECATTTAAALRAAIIKTSITHKGATIEARVDPVMLF